MNQRDAVTFILSAACFISVLWLVVAWDCQRIMRDMPDRLSALLAKHAENMASDDPAVREDAKKRWRTACRMLCDVPRQGHIGLMMIEAGRQIEREADAKRGMG